MTAPGETPGRADLTARDRLLLAATQLLDEAAGGPVSTREITERAGVRAPTLYHHFGSKQALLDAVVSHGFKDFLRNRPTESGSGDPLEDVRAGWDSHVAFGLEFPGAYAHIYGNVKPGIPCGVTEDVRAHLLEALQPAAVQGRLRVSPAEAAARILAACSGVTLALIQQPPAERDLGLSEQMRESVLASIANERPDVPALNADTMRHAFESVSATIEDSNSPFTAGERALMRELLARLASDL
jgi:AcrR family transcriptional regulator